MTSLPLSTEKIDELRAALKPFAVLGQYLIDQDIITKPDDAGAWGFDGITLTYGDFRRAATVIAGPPPVVHAAEPVAWQAGERELAHRWAARLLATLSTSPDHADDCLWLERLAALFASPQGDGHSVGVAFPKTLGAIHQAIDTYVDALVARQHGDIALDRAMTAVCAALGRSPIQEMDARRRPTPNVGGADER